MSCCRNSIRVCTLLRQCIYRGPLLSPLSSSQPPLSPFTSSLPEQLAIANLHSSSSCSSSDYDNSSQARHVRGVPSTLRHLSTESSQDDMDEEVEPIDLWEEEEENDAEAEMGDGGAGGGVVLQNCPWGEHVLSIAHEVLLQFGDQIKLFAFKTTPRGYIYVRLDKPSHEYGCPTVEELESYSRQYKNKLDEIGGSGEIPDDLALEVSSPGAERLLKVPDDLYRFKDMPMRVSYVEDLETKCPEKSGVFVLDSINSESGSCIWRLADVRENRDPSARGRPLSRKRKDWRLELPYAMFKRVTLYLD
ncbi:hypothetical protein NMG60_11009367 [Bertholletia excelsa]